MSHGALLWPSLLSDYLLGSLLSVYVVNTCVDAVLL
jgi:hypothetical protein